MLEMYCQIREEWNKENGASHPSHLDYPLHINFHGAVGCNTPNSRPPVGLRHAKTPWIVSGKKKRRPQCVYSSHINLCLSVNRVTCANQWGSADCPDEPLRTGVAKVGGAKSLQGCLCFVVKTAPERAKSKKLLWHASGYHQSYQRGLVQELENCAHDCLL